MGSSCGWFMLQLSKESAVGDGVLDNTDAFKEQGSRHSWVVVIERSRNSPETDTQTKKSESQTEGDGLEVF